jgi:hypothetical protein
MLGHQPYREPNERSRERDPLPIHWDLFRTPRWGTASADGVTTFRFGDPWLRFLFKQTECYRAKCQVPFSGLLATGSQTRARSFFLFFFTGDLFSSHPITCHKKKRIQGDQMTKEKKHVKRSTTLYSYSRSGTFASAVRSEALKRAPGCPPYFRIEKRCPREREIKKKTEHANKVPSLSYFFLRLSRLWACWRFFFCRRFPGLGLNVREARRKTKKDEGGCYESGIAPKMDGLLLFSGRFFFHVVFGCKLKKYE